MKLLAAIGKRYCAITVGHYDCNVTPDGNMADGGLCGCPGYAGYNRFSGETAWIDLPGVNFADLYNDYQFNSGTGKVRKYGVHKLSEVRLLEKHEIPDTDSFEWKVENAIWGTYGKDGKSPLKYVLLKDCETEHLNNILQQPRLSPLNNKIINHILDNRLPF